MTIAGAKQSVPSVRIPFEELALDAGEVAALLGQERRYVLERLAVEPRFNFPPPCSTEGQHKRWKAGEVMEWREANRVSRQAQRRSRRSKTANSRGSDAR